MNEELLLNQMGLILTQLRYARRALEDVERSTARYGSFAFTSALAAGPRFGEPPLFNGALKVYITNIHDLEPGGGIGSLIQGILGGFGGFLGNFIGGIGGGFLGGLALPDLVGQITGAVERVERIVTAVRAIMDRVGARDTPASEQVAQSASSGTSMPTLISMIDSFTALFRAASTGSGGDRTQSLLSLDERLRPVVTSINEMLQGLERVINGLILLVPMLVGALASVIVRIDTIKVALIDALQFILRNVFMIRGVVMVTVYDTLAAVARMGAGLLETVSTAVENILRSGFSIAGSVLSVVVGGIRFAADTVERAVNTLLPWVFSTVQTALAVISRNPVFSLLVHIIRTLPQILPALHQVLNGSTATLSNARELAAVPTDLPDFTTGTGSPSLNFTPLSGLSSTVLPQAALDALTQTVVSAASNISDHVQIATSEGQRVLIRAGEEFTRQAGPGEVASRAQFQQRLTDVRTRSDALAGALTRARQEAANQPQGALQEIANAYEGWLTGGGLRTLLGEITGVLASPEQAAGRGLVGQIIGAAGPRGVVRARAVIDIEDVVIQLQPPPPQPAAPPPEAEEQPRADAGRAIVARYLEEQHDLEERGVRVGPGAAFPQVPT